MAINGVTDQLNIRRDGKIRSGYKEKGTNKPVNTDYFLLHDAPQLQGVLGETASEIYFTVYSDNYHEFMDTDLRWYNSSQLLCLSMHNAPNENGQSMGNVAGYYGMNDVPGLKHQPFPGLARARVRQCSYKSCSNYVQDMCTEHMFLNVIVPQCSMGAVFTLDTTSINAILNAQSAFEKALFRYRGKIIGQIFRMFKKTAEVGYQKKDGSMGKRLNHVVDFELVNFEDYEAKFKDSIRPDDWATLLACRQNPFAVSLSSSTATAIAAGAAPAQLAPPEESAVALPAPISDEVGEAIFALANDPVFVKLADELATLKGMDTVKDAEKIAKIRVSTAKARPDLKSLVTHMNTQIKEAKKQQQATTPPPEPQQDTTASAPAGGLY